MSNLSTQTEPSCGGIVLLLPDGRGVRNFVLGPFLQEASRMRRVDALHTMAPDVLPLYRQAVEGNVHWHSLIPFPDRPLSFVLRRCLAYAQMYWIDNFPMRKNCNGPMTGSWRTKTALRIARSIGRMAASPRGIRTLDRLHAKLAAQRSEVEQYQRLFREIKPRVLFCSHQRPVEIIAPVLAARSLDIPTATFIFSWDNLSSKGRIAAPFDHFLVWSELMREEMLRYYPDVTNERIHVVGTPQFDFYADDSLIWTRDTFFQRIGADPSRRLICFSGGDPNNAIEDPQHLSVLMQQIQAGQIRGNPQVLLRPCPSDPGERFNDARQRFPSLIYAEPVCRRSASSHCAAVFPLGEDAVFLSNLIRHADLNVNFASTMTLDFAIQDKPVINLAFDTSDPPQFGMPMWEYYQKWDHYRPVIELGAARFARSETELGDHVNAYLNDPSLDREGRRRFTELEVGIPIGKSSQRIIEVLYEIVGSINSTQRSC